MNMNLMIKKVLVKPLPFLLIGILSLNLMGCSENPKYLDSVSWTKSSSVITLNQIGRIRYDFTLSLNHQKTIVGQVLVFDLTGNTMYTEPTVVIKKGKSKLYIGDVELNSLDKEDEFLLSDANPRNGESKFNKMELRFPYPNDLNEGQKLYKALREKMNGLVEYRVNVPVKAAWYDKTMLNFRFQRMDNPGENRVNINFMR